MKLQLQNIEKDGIIRVSVEGMITAEDFRTDTKNPLEAVLGAGWASSKILLDLSGANFIDSSAIGWLIGSSKAFREQRGMLVIHSIQPAVRQVLDLLKINRVVTTAADQTSARKMILETKVGEAA